MRDVVKYLVLLIVSVLSVSCVEDIDRYIMSSDEPHGVMFTISLEGQHTRATWRDEYTSNNGVPFDYRIIPDDLRMVILDQDGTRVGEISDLDYWPLNEAHTEFQFMGQLPAEVIKHINTNPEKKNYKFMVLANCGSNLSGEQYITYSHTQLDPSNEKSAIPMWGVTIADVSSLYAEDHLDLKDIWLLRAAAKVEVKLSEALKSTTSIQSATLNYYNQTGYVLPSEWSQVSYTRDLDQEKSLRVYRHAAVNLPFIKDEKTGNYYVYVTEYDNINYSGERNKISLEFKIGDKIKTFEDAISFCQYNDDGAPQENSHYNIVRNHIYEFVILNIAGSNLVLEYTVADWTKEDWDGNGKEYEEHDLSYPTYHNPVVPFDFLSLSADKQADYKIQTEPKMYYNTNNWEEGAFQCYFQILAPEDVEWKPIIMGTKEKYRIRVYYPDANDSLKENLVFDSGESNLQNDLGECEPGKWYHIKVFPLSDDGADNTAVDFGISYNQVWTDQYINLYVNGEYDNIRWPNSGDNPKLINIRHVSALQGNNEDN